MGRLDPPIHHAAKAATSIMSARKRARWMAGSEAGHDDFF